MYGLRFVNNARFKDISQITNLKNAVKETVIICLFIGQWTKTKLHAILGPTAINIVRCYRQLFVGYYFLLAQRKANYLVSYQNSVTKMNVSKLSKLSNIKLNFIFWRIGDIHNKFVTREFLTSITKKNIKGTD